MTLNLGMVTFDSGDPEPLARWWAERFDAQIQDTNEGWFVTVAGGTLPIALAFQRVSDPTPGKNKLHLDVTSEDLDTEALALVAAGAAEVARHEMGGFRWITLADPEGNQFCIAQH